MLLYVMLSAVAHVVCRARMQVVAMERVVSNSKEGSSSGSEADDKEQLSPVAVMDFPFDDDDELTDAGLVCSLPSFSLARLQSKSSSSLSIYTHSKQKWWQQEHRKLRISGSGHLGLPLAYPIGS